MKLILHRPFSLFFLFNLIIIDTQLFQPTSIRQ
jgi:hypothetical protein